MSGSDESRRFIAGLLGIMAVALVLRVLFLTADPPWNPTVGVVWHDEGAWTHNARNRALWGQWSLDAWNPLYIAPVFTGLEFLSFSVFGVGLWQARLVSVVAGLASVLLVASGARRVAGTTAGLLAGALVATNYVYVMYNRAALMESTMTTFIVMAWYCYVRAKERLLWGAAAGVCALLAFFTKAAAAFFVAALAMDALLTWWLDRRSAPGESRRTALAVLGGLGAGGVVALAVFVGPNWADYQFYNWQMSVTRKPSYDLRSLVDRVAWFPVLHDVFTRTWPILVVAAIAALTALARWSRLHAGERLLVWWIALGALELLVHDVGNERRFLFFIPAVAALAGITLGGRLAMAGPELARISRRRAALALPAIGFACYVLAGGIVRVFHLYEIRPNVRLAAALAVTATAVVYLCWPRLSTWLSTERWTPRAAVALVGLLCASDVVQYAQWASGRTYKNVAASRQLGEWLPADTLVHGKLANGLALENRIRPIFVGRGFGNYEDRKARDDVRYILTYVTPCVGYEGPVINDVIAAYPGRRVLATFDVAETPSGRDRAALIEKSGGRQPDGRPGDVVGRACD